MATAELGGVRIVHDRQGSGPPVVLVHGLGGNRAVWKHLASGLADELTVVSYDLRGAGESDKPAGPYSLDDFVSDLRGLIEHLGLERPALAGHSFGGSIALEYAARHPREASAVAVLGGPTELPEQSREGMRARAETVEREGMGAVAETVATNGTAPVFREERPEEFQAYVDLLAAADPRGYAATCRVVADIDIGDHLDRIEAPVLLVAGDRDAVAPPELNRRNAELIGDASFVELRDCGHILLWERPEALLEAVRPFLLERLLA